jgi:hypothetical protein
MADKQSKEHGQAIADFGPPFAKVMCSTDALLESLNQPKANFQLCQPIGKKSKRGSVYDCQASLGKFSEKQIVAKQLDQDTSNLMYLSIQHSIIR